MDYKCDKCTYRVGGGVQGKEFLEQHIKTAHPAPESKWEPRAVDRVYGDAQPEMVKSEEE